MLKLQVRLNTELVKIHSRKPTVKVSLRQRREEADGHNTNLADQDIPPREEEFDEIVLAVLADTSERVLGKQGGWFEKWVLGNTKWSDDITVTHTVSILNLIVMRLSTCVGPKVWRMVLTRNFTMFLLDSRVQCGMLIPAGYRLHQEVVHDRVRPGTSGGDCRREGRLAPRAKRREEFLTVSHYLCTLLLPVAICPRRPTLPRLCLSSP